LEASESAIQEVTNALGWFKRALTVKLFIA